MMILLLSAIEGEELRRGVKMRPEITGFMLWVMQKEGVLNNAAWIAEGVAHDIYTRGPL